MKVPLPMDQVKESIKQGSERRKQMKMGSFKRFRHQAKVLLAYVLLQAATLKTAAEHHTGQLYSRTCRADVVEVWGGHAEISYQAVCQGRFAASPYDIHYGIDLY